MIRILVLTLILIFITSMAIAASYLVGSTYPSPKLAAIFTNPDGSLCEMPCMFGIRPNVTRTTELLQIMRNHPIFLPLVRKESSAASGTEFQFSDKTQNIVVVLDTRNVVQSIHWRNSGCVPAWLSTVGDLANTLGQPSAIFAQPFTSGSIDYVFKDYQMAIESNRTLASCKIASSNERLDPHDLVLGIFLEDSSYFERFKEGVPWRGFRPVKFYVPQ